MGGKHFCLWLLVVLRVLLQGSLGLHWQGLWWGQARGRGCAPRFRDWSLWGKLWCQSCPRVASPCAVRDHPDSTQQALTLVWLSAMAGLGTALFCSLVGLLVVLGPS